MGYDITIGNAKPVVDREYGVFDWEVEPATHPDAPTFPNDDMTKNSNGRSPGYTAWSNTMRASGLYDLFLDEYEGLMRPHPGISMVKTEHVEQVERARDAFRAAHPNAVPRFAGFPFEESHIPDATDCDAVLARLIWLAWWMRWAVENCEYPAIHNR